jgi:hypothetical protein
VDEHQNYLEDNASGKSKDMHRKAQNKNTKHKHNTDLNPNKVFFKILKMVISQGFSEQFQGFRGMQVH